MCFPILLISYIPLETPALQRNLAFPSYLQVLNDFTMTLSYRQGVSIAILIFHIPALAIAIFLSIRHGLRRASGWRFMIVFTLARVLGSCLELATIRQPDNQSLYIGYATLLNVALSPLMLVCFGLLSRVISVCPLGHSLAEENTDEITRSRGGNLVVPGFKVPKLTPPASRA